MPDFELLNQDDLKQIESFTKRTPFTAKGLQEAAIKAINYWMEYHFKFDDEKQTEKKNPLMLVTRKEDGWYAHVKRGNSNVMGVKICDFQKVDPKDKVWEQERELVESALIFLRREVSKDAIGEKLLAIAKAQNAKLTAGREKKALNKAQSDQLTED